MDTTKKVPQITDIKTIVFSVYKFSEILGLNLQMRHYLIKCELFANISNLKYMCFLSSSLKGDMLWKQKYPKISELTSALKNIFSPGASPLNQGFTKSVSSLSSFHHIHWTLFLLFSLYTAFLLSFCVLCVFLLNSVLIVYL